MSNKKPVTGTVVNVSLDVTFLIEIFTFFQRAILLLVLSQKM
jgi:hypothetical protein